MFPSILSLEMDMEMRSEQDKELPTGETEAPEQLYYLSLGTEYPAPLSTQNWILSSASRTCKWDFHVTRALWHFSNEILACGAEAKFLSAQDYSTTKEFSILAPKYPNWGEESSSSI